jgi:hypothetical protein
MPDETIKSQGQLKVEGRELSPHQGQERTIGGGCPVVAGLC